MAMVYEIDLATRPHDMSKLIERDLVLYALKTDFGRSFHIWVFDKLGLEGANRFRIVLASVYQAFLRGEIHIAHMVLLIMLKK